MIAAPDANTQYAPRDQDAEAADRLLQDLESIVWPMRAAGHVQSIADEVAFVLGSRIITGQLPRGERLLELEISAEFKVSRNPVREALRILERDGFVEITPRRGAQVFDPSDSDVADIFEIVQTLFAAVGGRLAGQKNPEAIQVIRDTVEKLRAIHLTASPGQYVLLANALCMRMASIAGNARLSQLISRLMIQCISFSRISFQAPERRLQSIRNWEYLCHSIEMGNATGGESAGRTLVQNTASSVLRHMSEAAQKPPSKTGTRAGVPA